MYETTKTRLQQIAMFGQKNMCHFRCKVCLHALTLFAVVWCYDPCPPHLRNPGGDKVPSIPAHDIEWAFSLGSKNVQLQRQRDRSVRVFPKGLKTAETVHPQANQKPEIPQMELKQRIFDEVSSILASGYALSPTRVMCGLPQIHPMGAVAETAMEACVSKEEIVCNSRDKYRTADGSCNNLDHPTWGSAFSPVYRFLPPSPTGYDGLRKSVGCEHLPDPRWLSVVLHSQPGKRATKENNLYVAFGQFLAHDITHTAQTTTENNEAIQCCPPREDNHPQCAPINTTAYPTDGTNSTCMNFVRSAMYPSCMLGQRTQINTVTSFIDGSQIYGNSLNEMKSLRALDGTGKLLVQGSRFGPLLPVSTDPSNDRCSVPQNNQTCFRAGDQRVNQNPLLTSMHTIWVREHNRIATELKNMNQHWDEENLFQESRRIVIAELHSIVMTEYLPLTLGDKHMADYTALSPIVYAKDAKPHIYTEFSTAAFRFGHSMIDSALPEMPRKSGHFGHLLRDKFAEPFGLYEGEVDLLMMGASRTPAQALDRSLVPDVTNYLFRTRGQPTGLDLAAMNIQRGRDHALPSYFDVYNECNPKQTIESFYDLQELHLMTPDTVLALRVAYRDVRDIDLWTGMISELPVHDGVLGPTASCIVHGQFLTLIYGDRYWYTHKNQAGSFSEDQMHYFRWSATLAKIICANSNITEIPQYAMQLPSSENYIQQCRFYTPSSLWAWEENTRDMCHPC